MVCLRMFGLCNTLWKRYLPQVVGGRTMCAPHEVFTHL